MPSTYEPIATTTTGSAVASIDITSIPATYTDLVVIVEGTSSAAVNGICLRYNGDSSNLYTITQIGGNGTSVGVNRRASQSFINLTYTAYWTSSTRSNIIIHIQDYANTNKYKTCLSRHNTATIGVDYVTGLWRSNSAINQVTITNDGSGNIGAGTTVTVYGIKAA